MKMAQKTEKSDLQDRISVLWSDILNCPSVQPDTDFFDIGGDSITALNMLFEIEKVLGIEVSPTLLFENPTLRKFADAVAQTGAQAESLEEGLI
jgi:acyl carrier protein